VYCIVLDLIVLMSEDGI